MPPAASPPASTAARDAGPGPMHNCLAYRLSCMLRVPPTMQKARSLPGARSPATSPTLPPVQLHSLGDILGQLPIHPRAATDPRRSRHRSQTSPRPRLNSMKSEGFDIYPSSNKWMSHPVPSHPLCPPQPLPCLRDTPGGSCPQSLPPGLLPQNAQDLSSTLRSNFKPL